MPGIATNVLGDCLQLLQQAWLVRRATLLATPAEGDGWRLMTAQWEAMELARPMAEARLRVRGDG